MTALADGFASHCGGRLDCDDVDCEPVSQRLGPDPGAGTEVENRLRACDQRCDGPAPALQRFQWGRSASVINLSHAFVIGPLRHAVRIGVVSNARNRSSRRMFGQFTTHFVPISPHIRTRCLKAK
jgi:hypothetical protein